MKKHNDVSVSTRLLALILMAALFFSVEITALASDQDQAEDTVTEEMAVVTDETDATDEDPAAIDDPSDERIGEEQFTDVFVSYGETECAVEDANTFLAEIGLDLVLELKPEQELEPNK